jgi:hypothetical protein
MKPKNTTITFHPSRFLTPHGTAKWCHLDKPRNDTQFGTTSYEVTIVLDGQSADTKNFVKSVQKAATDLAKGIGKQIPDLRWMKTLDNGDIQISFKKPVREGKDKPIPVIDTAKQACSEPWGGDKIRVSFSLGLWKTAMGYGVKPYAGGVQVLERNRGAGNAADAFPDDLPAEITSSTDIPF